MSKFCPHDSIILPNSLIMTIFFKLKLVPTQIKTKKSNKIVVSMHSIFIHEIIRNIYLYYKSSFIIRE